MKNKITLHEQKQIIKAFLKEGKSITITRDRNIDDRVYFVKLHGDSFGHYWDKGQLMALFDTEWEWLEELENDEKGINRDEK